MYLFFFPQCRVQRDRHRLHASTLLLAHQQAGCACSRHPDLCHCHPGPCGCAAFTGKRSALPASNLDDFEKYLNETSPDTHKRDERDVRWGDMASTSGDAPIGTKASRGRGGAGSRRASASSSGSAPHEVVDLSTVDNSSAGSDGSDAGTEVGIRREREREQVGVVVLMRWGRALPVFRCQATAAIKRRWCYCLRPSYLVACVGFWSNLRNTPGPKYACPSSGSC